MLRETFLSDFWLFSNFVGTSDKRDGEFWGGCAGQGVQNHECSTKTKGYTRVVVVVNCRSAQR